MVMALVACASAPTPSPSPTPPPAGPATAPQPAGEPSATAPPAQAAPAEERATAEPTNAQPDVEALIQEGIAIIREMGSIMEGIVDEATARAAKPRLMELLRKKDAAMAGFAAVKDSVPADQRQAMKKKYEPELDEAMNKFFEQNKRVMQLPGVADVLRRMRPR